MTSLVSAGAASVELWIGSTPLSSADWETITVARTENRHDLVVIDVAYLQPRGSSFTRGAPVHMTWGVAPSALQEFYGYVSSVRPVHTVSSEQGRVSGSISVLGATAALNTVAPETWVKRNVPSVITEVAARKRINVVADHHDYVWPVLVRTGETDWEWIVKLAAQIGYRVVSSGLQLRVYDPARAGEVPSRIPAFTSEGLDRSIVRFSPSFDNTGDANREWFGFTASGSGDVLRYQSAPVDPILGSIALDRSRSGMAQAPTADYTTVEMYAEAHKRRNFWTLQARLEGFGDPDVRPGNLVNIAGPEAEYAGLWVVLDATHTMTMGTFTVDAMLGRDAVLDRPVRLRRASRPVPVSLIKGQWAATWSTA